MSKKDYFSGHSKLYAAFRPTYPAALYDFIFSHLKNKTTAWDCGTGNGQVARYLADYFTTVCATDISKTQLDHAVQAPNIFYTLSPAEKTAFPDRHFDLITVAQAIHWFDQELFYREVKRVGKPGGLVAAWGYALLHIDSDIDAIIMDFYKNCIGPYWDEARKLVDQKYTSISFPFPEISCPEFSIGVNWSLEHLQGYLESWSATQGYIKEKGINPVPQLMNDVGKYWNRAKTKRVSFPVFMKLGRI